MFDGVTFWLLIDLLVLLFFVVVEDCFYGLVWSWGLNAEGKSVKEAYFSTWLATWNVTPFVTFSLVHGAAGQYHGLEFMTLIANVWNGALHKKLFPLPSQINMKTRIMLLYLSMKFKSHFLINDGVN